MKNKKNKNYLSLALNILIVIFTVISIMSLFDIGATGNMDGVGFVAFKYFTVDSNVLCAISSVIFIFQMTNNKISRFAHVLKLVGTVSVTITFLVVLILLGPLMGYGDAYTGCNLYMHLLTPIVAVITYVYFDKYYKMDLKANLMAVLPVLIYGSVYAYFVLVKGYPDFYSFNSGPLDGLWYISFPVMLLMAFTVSLILNKVRKKH